MVYCVLFEHICDYKTTVTLFILVDGSSLALSIRDYDQRTNDFVVKHYKIRKMDNGGCFIAPKRTFAHVVALVGHYKGELECDYYKIKQTFWFQSKLYFY